MSPSTTSDCWKGRNEKMFGQQIVSWERSGSTKEARYRFVMVQGKGGVSIVSFAKYIFYRSWSLKDVMKDMQTLFVPWMELMTFSDMNEDYSGFPCMRCSTSDQMNHIVYVQELEGGIVAVGEWYGNKTLLSKTWSAHFVRSNSAVHFPGRWISWFHNQILFISVLKWA